MIMTSIRESIRRFINISQPLPAGTYHYQAPPSDPENYRLHLRLEPDGTGVLIVNAATVLHLNQTAAEYAFYMVQNLPEDKVAENVSRRYRVAREQAQEDYRDFIARIDALIRTPDLDPVTFLDFERTTPYTDHISAPYRLDCALTYEYEGETSQEAALQKRVDRELTSEEWIIILNKAWAAGIPHVIFTGGEPTLYSDLPLLIRHAEHNGQVTGLMTSGLRLADSEYLRSILLTGLDHITLIIHPELEQAWQVLDLFLPEDIFVAVHITITPENRDQIKDLLKKLADKGVRSVSLSARPGLQSELEAARQLESELGLDLVWNMPVPYSELNPLNLETENEEVLEGAGRAWMYVEPDGDVLASQGSSRILGNFLRDPWEEIWKKAVEK
jgi:hypothetical protein